MIPNTPTKGEPLTVTQVLPHGWIAESAGMRIYFDDCVLGTGHLPQVGDIIGFVGETGIQFEGTVRAGSKGNVEVIYKTLGGVLREAPTLPSMRAVQGVVEFESTASLEEVRNVMRLVEDGHVMLQTLRPIPLNENSLDRDTSVE